MSREPSFPPSDAVRRWTRALGELRLRIDRTRRRPDPGADPTCGLITERALELCGMLLQETAAAELELRRITAEQHDDHDGHVHLINKLPITCLITDASGYIRSANRAAEMLLGMSATSLQGRLLLLFIEDRAGFQDLLQSRNGATHYATVTLRPRELPPLRVQVTIAPDAPRDPTGWLWFIQSPSKFPTPGAIAPPRAE